MIGGLFPAHRELTSGDKPLTTAHAQASLPEETAGE